MTSRTVTGIAITLLVLAPSAYSQESREDTSATAVQQLSPELRTLLQQEMQALQDGMKNMLPLYAAGNLQEIAALGKNIHDSFILKKKLTKEQGKELHQKLPPAFIALDRGLHSYAGKLSHAASRGDRELVGYYYSRMLDTCVKCHAKFATHRFPLLKPAAAPQEH